MSVESTVDRSKVLVMWSEVCGVEEFEEFKVEDEPLSQRQEAEVKTQVIYELNIQETQSNVLKKLEKRNMKSTFLSARLSHDVLKE